MLGSRSKEANASQGQRWLTSRHTGESAYKPPDHRAGNAGSFGVPVVTNSCVLFFTHEAAGESLIRYSLCPLLERDKDGASLGREARRENEDTCLMIYFFN